MKPGEVIKLLERTKALLTGHFQLSSGLHSDRYAQCALAFLDPKDGGALGQAIADKFKGRGIDIVAGPALGGIIPAYEVARGLGVPCVFSERQEGVMTLRRGFSFKPGQKVLVVEDVITTGKSANELAGLVVKAGAVVAGAGCVADRSKGKSLLPVKVEGLVELDFAVYQPEACPLCASGSQAIKPGSRPSGGKV